MAHFAKVNESNIVEQVIVVADADCGGGGFPSAEAPGREFIASLGLDGTWYQSSYNHNFRHRYASIGGQYLPEDDVFIPAQPYPSWTLNDDHDWQAPVPMPETGSWEWDEATLSWVQPVEQEAVDSLILDLLETP